MLQVSLDERKNSDTSQIILEMWKYVIKITISRKLGSGYFIRIHCQFLAKGEKQNRSGIIWLGRQLKYQQTFIIYRLSFYKHYLYCIVEKTQKNSDINKNAT